MGKNLKQRCSPDDWSGGEPDTGSNVMKKSEAKEIANPMTPFLITFEPTSRPKTIYSVIKVLAIGDPIRSGSPLNCLASDAYGS